MTDKIDEEILNLNCRAHPQDPVYATLTGKRLTIECAYCGKVVIRMRVKEVCEP
jgi:aspartate carbamoyltransferase regulatory subunit